MVETQYPEEVTINGFNETLKSPPRIENPVWKPSRICGIDLKKLT